MIYEIHTSSKNLKAIEEIVRHHGLVAVGVEELGRTIVKFATPGVDPAAVQAAAEEINALPLAGSVYIISIPCEFLIL